MKKKDVEYYQISDCDWQRIHFVRPRFKGNPEEVLLYLANECCRIPACSCKEYKEHFFNAIKMFPGNIDKSKKTINNWRTEIPALFGFYTEDKKADRTETSKMAWFLHDNQDLTQFMKLFLFSFQIPGGHLKAKELQNIFANNIRFKPARTIIQVLMAGNQILAQQNKAKEMSISKEECTYCIFNDIRVTSGRISPKQVALNILDNRKRKLKYYNRQDPNILNLKGKPYSKGDVTRYAGDILAYMEVANLLNCHHGYYSLNGIEHASLDIFANDKAFFDGYDKFYHKKKLDIKDINAVEPLWFDFVNNALKPELFKTDLRLLFEDGEDGEDVDEFEERINELISSENASTKVIGDTGEALVYGHEKMRLKINGYENFVKLVKIVDDASHHPGYDIESYEADGTNMLRYIEVKTTISKNRIHMYAFHLSEHEWNVANTVAKHYCVYRLMLSKGEWILYILRDPVGLFKSNIIKGELRDGMEMTFTQNDFKRTPLLRWKK